MNQTHDFDHILADWLADETVTEVPARVADGAIETARLKGRRRPLPGWVATLKGDTMLAPSPARRAVLPRSALAVIAALLIAMLAISGAIVGAGMLLDRASSTRSGASCWQHRHHRPAACLRSMPTATSMSRMPRAATSASSPMTRPRMRHLRGRRTAPGSHSGPARTRRARSWSWTWSPESAPSWCRTPGA